MRLGQSGAALSADWGSILRLFQHASECCRGRTRPPGDSICYGFVFLSTPISDLTRNDSRLKKPIV